MAGRQPGSLVNRGARSRRSPAGGRILLNPWSARTSRSLVTSMTLDDEVLERFPTGTSCAANWLPGCSACSGEQGAVFVTTQRLLRGRAGVSLLPPLAFLHCLDEVVRGEWCSGAELGGFDGGPSALPESARRMSQCLSSSWKALSDQGGIEMAERWLPNQTFDAPRCSARTGLVAGLLVSSRARAGCRSTW